MEGEEQLGNVETLAEKCERLRAEMENAVRCAIQFYDFLAYLRQIALKAYKLTFEQKLSVGDLLGFLPDVRKALGANDGWIMCRRSGRKLPYKIIAQYIDGADAERIGKLKPWSDETIQNITWVEESETNLTRPVLLPPEEAQRLTKDVLLTEHYLIIAQFQLGGMDYLLVFSAPRLSDVRAPFDSYHQSFLMTTVCLVKAAYAIGEADGEASKEREIAEKRWREAREGDSRTAIAKAAQARLDLWLRQEAPSDNIPELPSELDETCADYIEYWRQKLALPSWRRRGVAGVLSDRVKDIVETIDFEPSESEDETNIKINIDVDIENSASQKAYGNGGKWLRVGRECQQTIGAVARAFSWAEASLRYTSKDKQEKYQEWIKKGRHVLSSFAKQNETLRRIFEDISND